jgi:hypothetical protein
MIAALIVGLLTAFFFGPLALIPVALLFVLSFVMFGGEISFSTPVFFAVCIALMNAGYLIGALIKRVIGKRCTLLAR